MKSYIKYKEDSEIYTKNMEECSMDEIFYTAAKMFAFSDCSDIEVLEIIIDNKEYFYAGWQPGMVFAFEDKDENEVWNDSFPRWNH